MPLHHKTKMNILDMEGQNVMNILARSVLGMQHQRQIERARVELRIAALEHIEKILRYESSSFGKRICSERP